MRALKSKLDPRDTLNPGRLRWRYLMVDPPPKPARARCDQDHARAPQGVRPLRPVPRLLPDVPPARPRARLAARAHLPDPAGVRGQDQRRRPGLPRAHLRLPGLPGLPDGLPVGRPVRRDHRGRARRRRAAEHARREDDRRAVLGTGSSPADRCSTRPVSACALYQRVGLQTPGPRERALTRLLPAQKLARDGSHARPTQGGVRRRGCAARSRRRGASCATGWASSRAASCRSFSARRTRRRCGCWRATAASCTARRGRGCCGALQMHTGDRATRRASWPAATSTPSSGLGLDAIIINAAGCGSTLKEYGAPARATTRSGAERAARVRRPRCKDVSEFLADDRPRYRRLGRCRCG